MLKDDKLLEKLILVVCLFQTAAVEAKYLDDDYEEDVYDDPYDEVDADILEDEMRRMIEENLDDNQLETAQTGSQVEFQDMNIIKRIFAIVS